MVTSARTVGISGPTTTAVAVLPAAAAVVNTWPSSDLPATACITFGIADFIRVPLPAARTTVSRGREATVVMVAVSSMQFGMGASAGL